MAHPKVISPEFLLWSQSLLIWSITTYAVTADPLNEEAGRINWKRWGLLLSSRAVLAAVLVYVLSRSIALSGWLLLIVLFQPLLRYRLPMQLLAEFETLWMSAFTVFSLVLIRSCHLTTPWVPTLIAPAQLAALCIAGSTLFFVVRGGTYIVRGILRKAGTLPSDKTFNAISKQLPESSPRSQPEASESVGSIAAAVESTVQPTVDIQEYNRGRLIGNLERIVLTIVVAAGSYAALAFLVAAKGVVRSDEFTRNRDFAEYFLIGSLSSVLVALCAGIALRIALTRLWPHLLSLQIQ